MEFVQSQVHPLLLSNGATVLVTLYPKRSLLSTLVVPILVYEDNATIFLKRKTMLESQLRVQSVSRSFDCERAARNNFDIAATENKNCKQMRSSAAID